MAQKLNRPVPFKIPKTRLHTLRVQVDKAPSFYGKLHHHPEYQITAIIKGEGIFYAGNQMIAFGPGDVLAIGSDVPHLFKNSNACSNAGGIESLSLFFDDQSFGPHFFTLPEMEGIKQLLQNSNRVIRILGHSRKSVHKHILSIGPLQEEALVIAFLTTLSMINSGEKEFLNSQQYQLSLNEEEGGKMNDILDHTFRHFNENIRIEEVAGIAHLSRSQFSKFFKLHTGKTYIQFLNELRIERACTLLVKTDHAIEQVCYEVGFHNVSNFVRQFKKVKLATPSDYRKSWVKRK